MTSPLCLGRNDEASGLVAKTAAFMLFGYTYSHLPYDTSVKPELVSLWGGNGKLMAMATKQAQGITCADTKLAEAATQARAAAMAAAAALVTASQSQEKYFVSALNCAGRDAASMHKIGALQACLLTMQELHRSQSLRGNVSRVAVWCAAGSSNIAAEHVTRRVCLE